MKFVMGQIPEWKGKPKASPLDGDTDFQQLKQAIASGSIRRNDHVGLYVHEIEDGLRLGAKNPARMVRDHLNRFLTENELEANYKVTCRLTAEDHVWGVFVRRTA